MRPRVILGLLVVAAAPLLGGGAVRAQADGGGDDAGGDAAQRGPTIQELMQRIERLEEDKSEMQHEIESLRREVGTDWLTQERADQIRAIVSDVMADADTRSSLLADGATGGWDGNFFLQSPDNRFRLNFGGQLQPRWMWSYHDAQPKYKSGFQNTRTQLFWWGHAFSPDLTYRLQANYSPSGGALGLKDAWIRWQLSNEWSVRGGQYKSPFLREELVRSWNQQVIERSLVDLSLSLGYTQGFEVEFANRTIRWDFSLDEGGTDNVGNFGLVGSQPQNSPALLSNTEYSVTSRFEYKIAGEWEQFKQFTSPPGQPFGLLVGFAGHAQRENPGVRTTFKDEAVWLAGTADVTVMFGGANLFSSFTWEYIDDTAITVNVMGFTLQGGMYFTDKFEGYARFEFGRFWVDGAKFFDDLALLTFGGNYYFDGQDVKFSADIGFGINPVDDDWDNILAGWRLDQPGDEPQVVIRTQLQLLF